MVKISEHVSVLHSDILQRFPSRTATATFSDWVANHAGLEQCLGVAGLLDPSFYEVQGLVVRERRVAEKLAGMRPSTPFGDDPKTLERYFNLINLAELFLMSADEAVHRAELVNAFGRTLQHFWTVALKLRLPQYQFTVELAHDIFGEEGLCITFAKQPQ